MINKLNDLFRYLQLPKTIDYKKFDDFFIDEQKFLICSLKEMNYDCSDRLQSELYTILQNMIPLIEKQFTLLLNHNIDDFISNIDESFYKNYIVTNITDYPLYRIRSFEDCKEDPKLEIKEIFHRPFNLSGKNERYDTPDIHSLYLSTSLNIAWYETGLPYKYTYTTVIPKNGLKIFNLNFCPYHDIFQSFKNSYYNLKIHNSSEREEKYIHFKGVLCNFLTFYPLLLACSLSVKEKKEEGITPQEYLIPNLLLDWIRHNNIDGIKYSSSTHYSLYQENGANYVFPTKSNKSDKKLFCDFLIQNFILTPPQLENILNYSLKNVDKDINKCLNISKKLHAFQAKTSPTQSMIDLMDYCKIITQYLEALKNNTIVIKEAQSFFHLCTILNEYFQIEIPYASINGEDTGSYEEFLNKIINELKKTTNNYCNLDSNISVINPKFKKLSLVEKNTYEEVEIDETEWVQYSSIFYQ